MNILLADDHALFRDGFSMIISSTVAESEIFPANSWAEALSMIKQQPFDIPLLDLFMPGARPWHEELATFMAQATDLPVCIVSASNNQTHIDQVFKLGVKGYINKTSGASEVQTALSKIVRGGRYVPRPKWQSLPSTVETANLKLTWRQREILILIAEGNSNKRIGLHLDITESTVKRHVYNLFKALNANSRIEAIQIAKSQGILTNSET